MYFHNQLPPHARPVDQKFASASRGKVRFPPLPPRVSTNPLSPSCPSSKYLERALRSLEDSHSAHVQFEGGETVVLRGEYGERYYVVIKGSCEAFEGEKVLHEYKQGQGFGERALAMAHEPTQTSCRAGPEGCELLVVSRKDFQLAFHEAFVQAGVFRGRAVRAKVTKKTKSLERDVGEFRGIRFATRAERFALPEVVEQKEHFDAFEFGPECTQTVSMFDQLAPPPKPKSHPSQLVFVHNKKSTEATEPDEDCLCLNVWTPLNQTSKLPVMCWIHGGAFISGSGSLSMYSGRDLASKGVVVVTINYRLGALGFLTGVPGVPINLGLHDQIAALRWIQKNISAFGGDPSSVTCFGESAGGWSVASLLGTQVRRDEKLFSKCIVQSANALSSLTEVQSLGVRDDFARALKDKLKLSKSTELTSDILNACSVKAIADATAAVAQEYIRSPKSYGIAMAFQPCCLESGPASEDSLFCGIPAMVAIARGVADDVTMLGGCNNNEYALFMADSSWLRKLNKCQASKAKFREMLVGCIQAWASPEDSRYRPVPDLAARAERVVDFYLPRNYENGNDSITEDEARLAFERIHSLWIFEIGLEKLLKWKAVRSSQSSGPKTFAYRVAYTCAISDFGSPHAVEVPLVFGTYKSDPVGLILCGDTVESEECSRDMMKAWIQFAKTGNPGWASQGPYKVFGSDSPAMGASFGVFSSPRERDVWAGFLDRVELDPNALTRETAARL